MWVDQSFKAHLYARDRPPVPKYFHNASSPCRAPVPLLLVHFSFCLNAGASDHTFVWTSLGLNLFPKYTPIVLSGFWGLVFTLFWQSLRRRRYRVQLRGRARKPSVSMSGLLTAALDRVRSYTGSVAWGPLVNFSRATILSTLQGIQIGQLTVIERDGSRTICGTSQGPSTELYVKREAFWLRLALFADMVSRSITLGSD